MLQKQQDWPNSSLALLPHSQHSEPARRFGRRKAVVAHETYSLERCHRLDLEATLAFAIPIMNHYCHWHKAFLGMRIMGLLSPGMTWNGFLLLGRGIGLWTLFRFLIDSTLDQDRSSNLVNVAKLRGQDIELANVVPCFFFLCLLSLSLFLFLVWEIFPQNFVLDNYSDRGTMHIRLLRMSSEAG